MIFNACNLNSYYNFFFLMQNLTIKNIYLNNLNNLLFK